MAASSGDDVPAQLATLLGRETMEIRRTEDTPPRVSVIDVASIITGHGADYASQAVRNVYDNHPEVREKITDFKFPGRRQRKTPVTDVRGIIEIIMLLRGCHAARVRRQAAELLCRYLGGDLALVDEVIALRGFQEELAAEEPENPRRVFGEVVEAAGDAELLSTSLHADRKRLLEEVRSVVRQELQQHHVWSFSKRSRNHRELMDMGRVVHGTALRELDQSEGIIRVADFLKDRIEPAAWMLHGRKGEAFYPIRKQRGTSSLEGYHSHQKRWLGSLGTHAPEAGLALLTDGNLRWNRQRSNESLPEEEQTPPVFAPGLLQEAQHLQRRRSGSNVNPDLP